VAKVESLITPKTKAIVPVHYAGIACDMEGIMNLASSIFARFVRLSQIRL
jgi:dTDP-4-amino-4,6-dideoxygalactose transaminase